MIIESKPVLLTLPDFAQAPEFRTRQQGTLVGLSEAPRVITYVGKRAQMGWPLNFAFKTRADILALEEFFYAQAGKWSSFWAPSWHGQLNPTAGIANGTSNVSISPVNYATIYDPTNADTSRPGHYIFLYDITGALHISLINSVSGASPEVLVMATPAARTWTLGQFIIGFVYLVRWATDTLSLEYSGPNSARVNLGVVEDIRISSKTDA
jgi:hypothetical protein